MNRGLTRLVLAAVFVGVFWISYRILSESGSHDPERSSAPVLEPSPVASTVDLARLAPPTANVDSPPSARKFHALKKMRPAAPTNPSEPRPPLEGNLVEFEIKNGLAIAYGDMVLGKPESGFSSKTGVTETGAPELWPTKNIPYLIAKDVPDPARVEKAVAYLNGQTAVKFVPFQGESDAIIFEVGDKHCYSYLGRIKGMQPIFLSGECTWAEILHEMMHALGFFHEQSRPDRDQFVEVLWENIETDFQRQFDKVPENWADVVRGSSFDFRSVMLYRPEAFAKGPGLVTMKSKQGAEISPVSSGLSGEDIRRVNRVYGLHE